MGFWYKTFSEQKDAIATNKELTINDAVVEGDEEAYEYHYSSITEGNTSGNQLIEGEDSH